MGLLLLALAPSAEARRARVFAVGPKFDLSWVQSPSTFRDKLLALMDRRRRGGGPRLVQRGADDVASLICSGPTTARVPLPRPATWSSSLRTSASSRG